MQQWESGYYDSEEPVFYDSKEMYEEAWMIEKDILNQVEKNAKELDDIKRNHLSTIYNRLSSINNRVWYIFGVLAVLIPLIIAILTKLIELW